MGSSAARPSAAERARIAHAYRRLPLAFERNRGQAASRARYLARGAGFGVYLTRTAFHLALERAGRRATDAGELSLRLHGADPASVVASRRLPGTTTYLLGRHPSRGITGVRSFSRIAYRRAWPGIDALLGGRSEALRYDFLLHPGADPGRIAIDIRGAQRARLDSRGRLVLKLRGATVVQDRPVAYQRSGDRRFPVASRYVLDGRTLRVHLGRYDHSRPLVIDPTLDYSTFLSGQFGQSGNGIAIGPDGSAYVAGDTTSTDFPTTPTALQPHHAGAMDAFVAKLNPSGSALSYSTFLGGGDLDEADAIAIGSDGAAYLTGKTQSANFPTTAGAFQPALKHGYDAFVAKLNPSGSALSYSTYLGGSENDFGVGIEAGQDGSAYLTGTTGSTNFPTTAGAFQVAAQGGSGGPFVTKLNPTGSALSYSTYLGGSDAEANGIALGSDGSAYVTGNTNSPDFPTTAGAFQPAINNHYDAFVTKLNPSGSALSYSTFLGSSWFDTGRAIAVDSSGSAYVAGYTEADDFPVTPGAFQTAYHQGGNFGDDGFVTKLNPSGSALSYSTYLGGGDDDELRAIAVDSAGSAHVTGWTRSDDFPTTANTLQAASAGDDEVFVTKLAANGGSAAYSTYLGGSGSDFAYGIATGPAGSAYITGGSIGQDYPTTSGAFQPESLAIFADGIVTKISSAGGGPIKQRMTVTKAGTGSGTLTSSPAGIDCGSTCVHDFNRPTRVTLTASPAQGSKFGSWLACDNPAGNLCTTFMTSDKTVRATFRLAGDGDTYPLMVTKDGPGSGTVTSNPGGIQCGKVCSHAFDADSTVTLYASANETFGSWSGCDATNGVECTVTVSAPRSVKASFLGRGGGSGAPDTRITKSRVKSKRHRATFRFKGKVGTPPYHFECKLLHPKKRAHQKKPWHRCKSPRFYKHLKTGHWMFKVHAIDKAGSTDPSPAKHKFRIKRIRAARARRAG